MHVEDDGYVHKVHVYILLIYTACQAMNTCMVLSSWSTISMEHVARANGGGMRWFQLTILKDNDLNRELIARAEQSGYRAIVITVDAPLLGKRLVKTPFQLPENLTLGNFIAHTTEKRLSQICSGIIQWFN